MEVAVAGAASGATIKAVLENLLSYPVEEIGHIWNFDKDFQELKDSISTILEFLDDAEMKDVTEEPVKRWLKKLDTLTLDAEYVYDQLNYHRRRKVESGFKKKVSSYLNNISMAHKITDIEKKLKSINEEALSLGLQTRLAGAQARGAGIEWPETDSFSRDRVFVGRDDVVKKMVKMLITCSSTKHEVSVLPVVGMGGVGKTTLTREIFKHADIGSNFGKRIWVHVKNSIFDPVYVLRNVVESSTAKEVEGSRDVIMQELQNSLKDKRYLLVLDNVWKIETNNCWDSFIASLKGINYVKGNVIMVTTRDEKVASIVKTLDIQKLAALSDDDCWLIIKAEAFQGEDDPSQFETTGAKIARRCRGLPSTAQVVGSLLRGKSKDEWVSVEEKWLSEFDENEDTVSKILKLSYDSL